MYREGNGLILKVRISIRDAHAIEQEDKQMRNGRARAIIRSQREGVRVASSHDSSHIQQSSQVRTLRNFDISHSRYLVSLVKL